MTSRRSLLAVIGAGWAASIGWAWVETRPEPYTHPEITPPPRYIWDLPVADHCYAEGMDPGTVPGWSETRGWSR